MSKKHKRLGNYNFSSGSSNGAQLAGLSHEAEYRIIKLDLIKVIVLNAVYLVLILGLYFGNQSNHFLDNWFARVLHF